MRIAISLSLVLLATLAAAPLVSGSEGSAARSNKVKAVNFEFTPKTITIGKSERVSWTAVEGSHTVTFKGGFDKEIGSGDSTVSKKFNKTGTFRYFCRPHKSSFGMKGKVVVN